MFRSNIKSSYAPRSYNIPIPFEAGPFLACVYKLGLSVKEPNVSNDQLQELFEMLYEIAVPSTDDQDINDFYRYICFQNAHFTTAVLVKLWEGELTERFENLKGLAKQKSIDLQIRVLVDCLTSLDRCALFLKMQSETDSICEKNLSDTDNVDVVRHLLEQLLSERHKDAASKNIHASYLVNNSRLDNGTRMKETFEKLKNPNPKDPKWIELLEVARKTYLNDLVSHIRPHAPQNAQRELTLDEKYMQIRRYLDVSAFHMDERTLMDKIHDRCIYKCKCILDFCSGNLRTEMPLFSDQSNYNSVLIDYLIQGKMNQDLQKFREMIWLLVYFSGMQQGSTYTKILLASQLINDKSGECTNAMRENISFHLQNVDVGDSSINRSCDLLGSILGCLKVAWDFLDRNDILTKSEVHGNNQIFLNTSLLEGSLCAGKSAAVKFEKDEWFFESHDDLVRAVRCYGIMLRQSNPFDIVIYGESLLTLMRVSFLIVLQKCVEHATLSIMQDIKNLPGV